MQQEASRKLGFPLKKTMSVELDSANKIIKNLESQIKTLKAENKQLSSSENSSAKIFVLETDLQVSQMKCKELHEQNQKKKEKNKNLQLIINQKGYRKLFQTDRKLIDQLFGHRHSSFSN